AQAESEIRAKHLDRADELLARCPERRRGWEWNLLRGLRRGGGRVLPGYNCHYTAFSPDGSRRVGAGKFWPGRGQVWAWDTVTGRELYTAESLAFTELAVSFSPDGHRFATGGGFPGASAIANAVRLLDAATGRVLATFRGHTGG